MIRIHARLTFVLFSAVTIASFTGCSGERQQTAPGPETVRHISVLAVQSANVPDLLEAVGTVSAAQTSNLASQTMGNII